MNKIIKHFQPLDGKHCITNSLKQIFSFYGCPLSEQMLFGLGEGLDFTYINLAHSPMVSGRSKILEFEEVLSKRLGIEIKCNKSNDNKKILKVTKNMIDNNHPVLVYVDMPYLPYLSLNANSHFGGHAVVFLFKKLKHGGCIKVALFKDTAVSKEKNHGKRLYWKKRREMVLSFLCRGRKRQPHSERNARH